MKKLLTALTLSVLFSFGIAGISYAQDGADEETTQMESMEADSAAEEEVMEEAEPVVEETMAETMDEETAAGETQQTFHQRIKYTFIDG